jgi:hypothetical protein
MVPRLSSCDGEATAVVNLPNGEMMELHLQKGLGHSRSVIALYLLLIPAVSMAYFDPGSGAFMVQTIFTLVGAALFYMRHPMRLFRMVGESLRRLVRSRGGALEPIDAEELGKLDRAIAGEDVK